MYLRWLTGALVVALTVLIWTGLAGANPARWMAEGWRTDFSKQSVDLTEIISGGPPKDGIPATDDPRFVTAAEADDLQPREPVIQLTVGGETRAYPLSILMFHEIVNDTVAGIPVAVTYCPLCNAAIVFERELGGTVLDFGTTGKLRHSDLVMYDRQTESWWQQFTGTGIVGAMTGKTLDVIPSGLVSWQAFAKRHPDAKVLAPPTSVSRPYGQNPYVSYDSSATPFLYRGEMPDGIEPMARVVVVREAETNKPVSIVSLAKLRENKSLERGGYRLSWDEGQASALDTREIGKGREVGNVSVTGLDGKPAVHDITFAFVAHAFHPEMKIEG
ncbi:DUF3179 domain-containing protein [Aurantimonas marina]|uniref:DUF3179 domain-containing protein n=1 Tax=Aurantimonas marina TaxID=2780508 RepID=UPI0019D0F162|nr:DUF3179 domain-containing protein [Aurantimonas marina]